jgi:hypothetical protein
MRTIQIVTSALVFVSTTLVSVGASAQQVAFHDLATEKLVAPPTRTWIPRPEACPETDAQFIDIMCGRVHPSEPGNLSLKIEDVQPSALHLGDS